MILLFFDLEWSLYQSYKNPPPASSTQYGSTLAEPVTNLCREVRSCGWPGDLSAAAVLIVADGAFSHKIEFMLNLELLQKA